MDFAQLGTVFSQGLDLLLLLFFAELLLPLELPLLGNKLFEAQLVVLLLLLIKEIFDNILRHIILGIIWVVVVGDIPMLVKALIDVETEVEGAASASWPALQVLELVNVLDYGEVLVTLRSLL